MYIDFKNWDSNKINQYINYSLYKKTNNSSIEELEKEIINTFVSSAIYLRDKNMFFNVLRSKKIKSYKDLAVFRKELTIKDIEILFSHPVFLFHYTKALIRLFKKSDNEFEIQMVENCKNELVKTLKGIESWEDIPFRSVTNLLRKSRSDCMSILEEVCYGVYSKLKEI